MCNFKAFLKRTTLHLEIRYENIESSSPYLSTTIEWYTCMPGGGLPGSKITNTARNIFINILNSCDALFFFGTSLVFLAILLFFVFFSEIELVVVRFLAGIVSEVEENNDGMLIDVI